MNSMERASHPSRQQVKYLLDIIEKDPLLMKKFPRYSNSRARVLKTWQKMAVELNNLGGCVKTWKQWTKYWADKKCAVKKKGVLMLKNKTGNDSEKDLNEIDTRILALINGESSIIANKEIESEDFTIDMSSARLLAVITASCKTKESNKNTNYQDKPCSPSLLDIKNISQDAVTASEPEQHSTLPPSPASTVCSDDLGTDTLVAEVTKSTEPVVESPPCSPTNSFTSIPACSNSPTNKDSLQSCRLTLEGSPAQQCSPINTSPSSRVHQRRRRVKTLQNQRQSQFARVASQFILLEEQRLETDRRYMQVFERLAYRAQESERATARALLAIGEGLKLLAEAIKNK